MRVTAEGSEGAYQPVTHNQNVIYKRTLPFT